MIQAKIINRIKFQDINLQSTLEEIAKDIIIPDIIHGIDTSQAIDGGSLPPNADSTKRYKEKHNLGDKPLIATGELRRSFYYRTSGKYKVIISIEDVRKAIGGYLQNDGKGGKYYRFFGISKDAYKDAMEYTNSKVKEITSGHK